MRYKNIKKHFISKTCQNIYEIMLATSCSRLSLLIYAYFAPPIS